jgi:hypothetical protein
MVEHLRLTLLTVPGAKAFSLLVRKEQPLLTRLFLKKSRT